MSKIQKRDMEGEGHEQREGEVLHGHWDDWTEAKSHCKGMVVEKVSKGILALEAPPTDFQLYLPSDTEEEGV